MIRKCLAALALLALPAAAQAQAGLPAADRVARIARLRLNGDVPLAIERAALSASILPDPELVGTSLYAQLDKHGNRPVRAIQRIRAISLGDADAALLDVAPGSASLHIERTSYLASGRVVEYTRSIYRGDTYDVVVDLRLHDAPPHPAASMARSLTPQSRSA